MLPDAAERLFLDTLEDLRERVSEKPPNSYRLLRSAGLLRHLLLEGEPLIDAANRRALLKIKFTFRVPRVPDQGLGCDLLWDSDGIDPKPMGSTTSSGRMVLGRGGMSLQELAAIPDISSPIRPLQEGASRDQLLATTVGICARQRVSVRELIRAVAHALGGIHHGPVKSSVETGVAESVGLHLVRDVDGFLLTLRSVGIVVLEGLEPLRQELVRRRAAAT